MIEERIVRFVTEALISSAYQLNTIGKRFSGSKSIVASIGTDVSAGCLKIKEGKKNAKIFYSQHHILFDELAETFAGIKSQSIVIYLLGLSLKAMATALVNYEEFHKGKIIVLQPSIEDKTDKISDADETIDKQQMGKCNVGINTTKWISCLEIMLLDIKDDPLVKACLYDHLNNNFGFTLQDMAIATGMIAALEIFVEEWKTSVNETQVGALTDAVSRVEKMLMEKKYLSTLKTNSQSGSKKRNWKSRINPGMQLLATSFRSLLEAIKNYNGRN